MQSIFISYNHKNNKSKNVADSFCKFSENIFEIHIDNKDLHYGENIQEYMKKIRKFDFSLIILCDEYLKSRNCMYEALEFMRDDNYSKRMSFIIMNNVKIFNEEDRLEYIQFWKTKYDELDKKRETLDTLDQEDCIKELKIYKNIQINIGQFLSFISNIKSVVIDDCFSLDNFQEIINFIEPTCPNYDHKILFSQNDFNDRAIEDYNKLIKHNPNDAIAYCDRGTEYFSKGNYAQAIEDYDKAISLNPNTCIMYNNRGLAYHKKGNYVMAIRNYNKAIELNPDNFGIYNNRGLVYYEKGDYNIAIEDFNKAIDINSDFVDAYVNKGNAYSGKGDNNQAINEYTKAININPELIAGYNNRGIVYSQMGDYDSAIEDFNSAINIDPNDANAYCDRGTAYFNKGNYDKGIKNFNIAIKIKPNYALAYCNCGNAYARKENYDQAIENYDKAIDINPEYIDAIKNRALAYSQKAKKQK
jgi:tetratricopeptide (TPR) repeat protein